MARRVEQLPARKFGPGSRYPWAEWADGSVWQMKRGEDFEVSPRSFASYIRQLFARQGLQIKVRVDGATGTVYLQVIYK